jgi:hypothetical protein
MHIITALPTVIGDRIFKYGTPSVVATGWTTEGSEFESRWGQEFSLLQTVQTGSEVHPTPYPVGTGGSFPGGF